MLTPLLLLWPVSLALTWLVAQGLANKPFDRALEYNAQALAQLVIVQRGKVQFNLPQSASEILRADESDTVFFQVSGTRGEYLAGERDLPRPPPSTRTRPPARCCCAMRNTRASTCAWPISGCACRCPASPALVQVAETREKRSVLATEIIKGVMLPQFVILPLAALLVGWRWRAASSRCTGSKSASARASPRISRPSTTRMCRWRWCRWSIRSTICCSGCMTPSPRKSAFGRRRPPAQDPAGGLRMQADLAQREGTNTEDLKRSLAQIGRSSMRATHTVNQLLALARAESAVPAMQGCNLVRIVTDVVQDCLPRAMDKHIDLGYEGASASTPGVWLNGNATCSPSWCAIWWTTPSTTRHRPANSQAWSPCACRPIISARFCCCRSRTPAPACRWPSAN
jgi:two-component system sensor histidine kinase TctE